MDVTCERCGTEYEFEETLVSERGTTVKCTQCGHLFKVFRPRGEGARPWILGHGDGRRETLTSLGDLQKRITHGELAPSDRISRSGEDWKTLGEIAELEPFFRAAQTAAETARQSSWPPTVTDAPVDRRSSRAPQPRTPKRTLMGVGILPKAPPPETGEATFRDPDPPSAPPSAPSGPPGTVEATFRDSPPSSAPPSAPSAPPEPRSTATMDPEATVAPPRAPRPPRVEQKLAFDETIRAGSEEFHGDSTVEARKRAPTLRAPESPVPVDRPSRRHVLYLDDDAPVELPKSGGPRVGLWVVLILLIAGASAAALQWKTLAPVLGLGGGSHEADPLAEGDAELARDTAESYAAAVAAYGAAPESAERSVRLGRAHAAWAQWLHFHASDLDARALADPSLAAEAAPLHQQAQEHAEMAAEAARSGLSVRTRYADADVVLADALRLLGSDEASGHLDRGVEGLPEPTAELRLAQALARADAEGLAGALPHARRAVAMEGAPIRAGLLLARVALAADDVGEARSAIRAVRDLDSDHPEATYLADAIDRGLPPAAPVVDVRDGGSADAGAAEESVEAPNAPATADDGPAPRASGSGTGSAAPPEGRDYSWYIRRGDELRRDGSYDAAESHYEQALALRPGSPEATTGLGYVALMSGHPQDSLAHFRRAIGANYGDAYMGLGDAYRRMGSVAEARRVYESYLGSQPNGVHASRARRMLEELPGGSAPGASPPTDAPSDPPSPAEAGNPASGTGTAPGAEAEAESGSATTPDAPVTPVEATPEGDPE